LTNVFFADDRHGWASGHSGIILTTTNSGDSWERVSEPDPEISYFGSFFFDEWNGIFVGSYGEYSKTNDAGFSLENELIDEEEPHFYAIERSPNGTLFLAGEMGQIHRSKNQGRNWTRLKFPYEGSLFGILCLDDDTLLAYGLRGHIFRSTNSGTHWEEIKNSEPEMLTSGIVLNSGTLLLTSIADKVMMSSDWGMTFHSVQVPGINGTVAVAENVADNTLVFCGRHGVLTVDAVELETALRGVPSNHE
jgi:photosystem II stability/assembly factor-like uncharacterized protein